MRELSKKQTALISGGVPKSSTPAAPVNGPTLVTAPNLTGSVVTLLNTTNLVVSGQIVKGDPTLTFKNPNTGLKDTFNFTPKGGVSDTFGGNWGNWGWGVTVSGSGQMSIDLKYSLNDTSSSSNTGGYVINGSYGYSGGYSGSSQYSNYA